MVALDGHIVAQGPRGTRTIRAREFVTGPFQNVLDYDELAIEAVVPAPSGVAYGGYLKLERRVGDFATAAVAVALEISGGAVTKAGIALTGVGGTTVHAAEASAALVGKPLTPATIDAAAAIAAAAANPRSDHRGSATYKRHIIQTFTARVLRGIADSNEKAA